MKSFISLALFMCIFVNLFAQDEGLVAYYPFDGNADDMSGNGLNGTISGAVEAPDRFSTPSGAYRFDGVDDYIEILHDSLLDFGDGLSFTLSLWVNGSPEQATGAGIICKGSATGETYTIDCFGNNAYRFYVRGSSATLYEAASQDTPSGEWDHLVAVFDAGARIMTLYCNTNEIASETPPSSLYGNRQPVSIGNRASVGGASYSYPFKGSIDDVRIYNRVLSEEEILELYHQGGWTDGSPLLIHIPTPTIDRRPIFSWHPVDSASEYTIQIDTSRDFSSPINNLTTTDTSFTPLADLPIDTIYWRVSSDARPGLFSSTSSFIIRDKYVPILLPYTPDPTQERRPILQWHSVEDVSEYHLLISDDPAFPLSQETITTADTFYTLQTDLPYGMIYWKVKSDMSDTYSDIDSFYIQPDSIPFLYAFAGSEVEQESVVFKWKPVVGASTYRIQVDTSIDFSSPIIALNTNDTLFEPLSALAAGTYYWRVSCDIDISLYSPIDSVTVTGGLAISGSISLREMDHFGIYPNPCVSAATICFRNPDNNACIEIFSVNGKKIAEFMNVKGNQARWDASGMPNGVYVLRVSVQKQMYTRYIHLTR